MYEDYRGVCVCPTSSIHSSIPVSNTNTAMMASQGPATALTFSWGQASLCFPSSGPVSPMLRLPTSGEAAARNPCPLVSVQRKTPRVHGCSPCRFCLQILQERGLHLRYLSCLQIIIIKKGAGLKTQDNVKHRWVPFQTDSMVSASTQSGLGAFLILLIAARGKSPRGLKFLPTYDILVVQNNSRRRENRQPRLWVVNKDRIIVCFVLPSASPSAHPREKDTYGS